MHKKHNKKAKELNKCCEIRHKKVTKKRKEKAKAEFLVFLNKKLLITTLS